jgi:AraC-type DNA-binding domain-containing proteins
MYRSGNFPFTKPQNRDYIQNMQKSDMREIKERGVTGFPFEYYHLTPYTPKYQMVFHWHLDFEIVRILKGDFTLHLDENAYFLKEGDIAFIDAGTVHGGSAVNSEYECIVFSPELIRHREYLDDAFIRKITHKTIRLKPVIRKGDPGYPEYAALLFDVVKNDAGTPLETTGALKLFFSSYEKGKLYEENAFSEKNGIRRTEGIKRVIECIETNYASPLTLSGLSSLAGLSPKYFCAFFKEMTGRTPFDYVNLVRIEKASLLLMEGENNVLETALATGFSDATYFARTFRRYKGVSPREYKKLQASMPRPRSE